MSFRSPTWRRILLTCLIALPLAMPVLVVEAGSAAPQVNNDRVTSDTPEYCLFLLDKVSAMVRQAHTPPPVEVTQLSTEGQRMCDHGLTRPGILRLRRAVVLMQETDGNAGPDAAPP